MLIKSKFLNLSHPNQNLKIISSQNQKQYLIFIDNRIYMKIISHLLAIILLIAPVLNLRLYQKILNSLDPEAKCLDGSTPAIYLDEGDSKNILFYMMGGADCAGADLPSTLEHCYQRSKQTYGSSKYWASTKVGEGILSTDASKNIFANWTKVIMLYCDGAFHQGYTKEPYSYKDTKLYFRGSLNTRAHFQYIHNRYNLSNAERVVLSGSSAGGISTFLWVDYLKKFINSPSTKVFSIIDSGIFLDPSEQTSLRQAKSDQQLIFKVSNVNEGAPNRACANANPQKEWYCLTTQGAIPYLQVQSLFINSAYDQYIIRFGGDIRCLQEGVSGYSLINCNAEQMGVIQFYRSYYMQYLKKITSLGHNIWSIDCSWHANMLFDQFYVSPLQKVPMEEGDTMQEAIYKYIFEGQKILSIDLGKWPSNTPCAY